MEIILSESSVLFIVATLITEVLFKQLLMCNELNMAEREGKWILHFQTMAGTHSTIVFFIVATFDYRCTFQTVLDSYCCVAG